ncbi:MAG TPA: SH3 domain-containing protein [Candidatus Acidoferrum sp.]|nr:SH3 domain-containing protein [Candidatus Acidoferrum sp.]
MKRKLLVAVPLLCLVAVLAWIFRPKHESLGEAYISERSVTLFSSIAQVREQVGVLYYGERVDVLAHRNDYAKVRTTSGVEGWIDGRYLMDPALWQRSEKLLEQTKNMAVQARGRTKTSTNLRIAPGRKEPRLYQFGRGTEVEIFGRTVADWVQVTDEKEAAEGEPNKKEDWYLVRGIATRPPGEGAIRNSAVMTTTQPGDQTIPIAGWVVGRFISLDLPDPVQVGTSAANVRPIAWFELNRIRDDSGEHPQYLVAGTRSGEGQPCDFTTLRVFTWNLKKSRYETAYIENDLCGALPIQVGKGSKGEPEFRFNEMGSNKEERIYHLVQTVIRRERLEGSPAPSKGHKATKAKH